MGFDDVLSNLGDMLDQQFMTGENKNKSAQLGSFANQYDRSAQRSYTEQGSFRNHYSDNSPKQLDILLQDPDITVLVKKRMFASLAENFRPDLMDKDERMFLLATKTLFQNKCKQISNYEKLTKIAQISTQIGEVDYHLLPILFGAVDALDAVGIDVLPEKFKSAVSQVRQILAFNTDNSTTTWQTNPNNMNGFGAGTGVIEFTTAMDVSTTTSLKFAAGKFSIKFSDPYNLMSITNNDIEAAISDAYNPFYNNKGFQLLENVAQETIDIQRRQLNLMRANRAANPIKFIVAPETFVGKRIRAIIDVSGIEINFNISALNIFDIVGIKTKETFDPAILIDDPQYNKDYGEQGLTSEEADLLYNMVSSMYNQLSLQQNSRRRAKGANSENNNRINNLRRKLRLHYANKLVIQPMDTVNIFINSKKKLDSKITGGLQSSFTGLNFMQGIGNLMQNIKDNLTGMGTDFSVEKSIFVGNDFPSPLWMAMRSQFVSDKKGVCVFAGIFEEAVSHYSNGRYEVTSSGGDNAKYFTHGIINMRPSMDVYNGPLLDPLTPFDLKYDTVSGVDSNMAQGNDPELLDENKKLFSSVFIKSKNGPAAGSVVTEEGYFNRSNKGIPRTPAQESAKVFYDPEGLVYRWKEGIASLVWGGPSYQAGNIRGVTTNTDPFAGQDMMNVLSLLITGEPYNYATYYKAATATGSLARDSVTNQTSSVSYFRGLRADIKNRNAIYGDFIPFKLLAMDEASFEKNVSAQLSALGFDKELRTLIEQRAILADNLIFMSGYDLTTLKSQIADLDAAIKIMTDNVAQQLKTNTSLKVIGNDISYDYSDFNIDSKIAPTEKSRRELRKKIKFLTRRLAWKVRGNQDANLFIVDNVYDKDYDIQAFEQTFTDLSTFKSEYTTVDKQIEAVANKLNLEVFCNTQGHIEIRNPKYNNIPSSVFSKMLKQKDETGIQVFPQFLQDLFTVQLKDLYEQIEIIEDRIRLYCFSLNKIDDSQAMQFINSVDLTTTATKFTLFYFLSSESGTIYYDVPTAFSVAHPELYKFNDTSQALSSQSNLSAFSSIGRANLIQSASPTQGGSSTPFKSLDEISKITNVDKFKQIKDRLFKKSGQIFSIDQEFGNSNDDAIKKYSNNFGSLQIINKIAQLLSDRSRAIKLASNALNSLKEGLSLNEKEKGGNKLLVPSLAGNKTIPSSFEHMIEDESYDDLGIGSSKRYVIKNRDIISYTITEKKPTLTSVEVAGNLSNYVPSTMLPADLNVQGGTNLQSTAYAVDYDLWRMYGISYPQKVDALFLHDPQAQMAPYAVSILNRSRKEILQGNITIVGNEFQQPGETIYIENRDLLFYVDSVSHTFSYGKTFQTSMTLGYGHNPGEYIPTSLDVVGKILYKNTKIAPRLDHKRQGNVFNQVNIGALALNFSPDRTNDLFDKSNKYITINQEVIKQVIKQAATSLSLSSANSKPILELRTYYNSENGGLKRVNDNMIGFIDEVRQYLIGATDLIGEGTVSIGLKPENKRLAGFKDNIAEAYDSIVNSGDTAGEYRYPSNRAFYLAKDIVGMKAYKQDRYQEKVDNAIWEHIIDIWIVTEDTTKVKK